uniref:Uncharacterized protein n=1 Tax=Vitis vinifera TaxID=29760 RepID=F6HYH4_VITVI
MLFKQVGGIGPRVFSSSSRSRLGARSYDWALRHGSIFFSTGSGSATTRDRRGLSYGGGNVLFGTGSGSARN